MDTSRESRKRLRPWLERIITGGDCPGVVWEKKEERTFRIPWRHFNNKDWVERDSKIFLEWAKYTGKYKDGDPMEYPVWKTRLRCALKKIPEIKELSDLHHLEDPNPYRIYQFVDVPVMKRGNDFDSDCSASPASGFASSPAHARDFLEESSTPPPNYYEGGYKCQIHSPNVPTVVFDDERASDLQVPSYNNLSVKQENPHFLHQYEEAARGESHMEHSPLQENPIMGVSQYVFNGCYNIPPRTNFVCQTSLPSQNFGCSSMNLTAVSEVVSSSTDTSNMQPDSIKGSLPSDLMSLDSADLCHMSNTELPRTMSGLHTPEINLSAGSHAASLRNHQVHAMAMQDDVTVAPKVEHGMQLTLYYGSPKQHMLQETIKGRGCRLFYGAVPLLKDTIIEEEMFGPKNVQQLEMPIVEQCADIPLEQKKFIHGLLDNMERGLVLTIKDGDIYAQRLCRTRVFATDGETQSILLDRKEKIPTKVFDFNGYFKNAYENYRQERSSEIPKPYIYLTFGQEIKKDRHHPMSPILIQVMVMHAEAKKLTSELTSSTGSFQPLLSSLDSHDKLLDKFKEMHLTNS